jgi:hypothetical protein
MPVLEPFSLLPTFFFLLSIFPLLLSFTVTGQQDMALEALA